jgi:lipoate-protein ligase A
MRVFRGRAPTPQADQAATNRIREVTRGHRERALRVWRPHRHVSFGPRDVAADRYELAHAAAEERGFPVLARDVGGRAVACTETTVAFALSVPADDASAGTATRYEQTQAALERALDRVDVIATAGEPAGAFCPGGAALQAAGKLVGISQHVAANVATVGGVVIVRDHETIASVLEPVYAAFDVPFDPDAVGSVARAGGTADPDRVVDVVEAELVGDRDVTVERVGDR